MALDAWAVARQIAVACIILVVSSLGQAKACGPKDLTVTATYASGFLRWFQTEENIGSYIDLRNLDARRAELTLSCKGVKEQVESSIYDPGYESSLVRLSWETPTTTRIGSLLATKFQANDRARVFLCGQLPVIVRKSAPYSEMQYSYSCGDGHPNFELRWIPAPIVLYLCSVEITDSGDTADNTVIVITGFSVCKSGDLNGFVGFAVDLALTLGAKR